MKKEIFIVGTRPEIIKVAPILLKLDRSEYFLIHTGQHKELAEEAFHAFSISPDWSFNLMQENQSLAEFTSRCYAKLTQLLPILDISHVWVHGDTASALVGAQVAKLYGFNVIHLEAGLRSWDMKNPWPEEMFRIQIDTIADVLLAPTTYAKDILLENDNYSDKIVDLTGNTVVDALEIVKSKLPEENPFSEKFVLATIHRRESFGPRMIEIFKALKILSKNIKIVIPAHPNPNVRKALKEVGLDYVEPMSYIEFLTHMKFCEYIITDSGGLQEEAPSFQKKTIVLRNTTERPEALEAGISILISNFDIDTIIHEVKEFAANDVEFHSNPFGDGHAADYIIMNLRNGKYD